jgi:hypothetical protein
MPIFNTFPPLMIKDRTGLTVSSVRRQMGFEKTTTKPKAKLLDISPSVASSEVEELSDEIFTQEVNLKNGESE